MVLPYVVRTVEYRLLRWLDIILNTDELLVNMTL